MACLLPDINGTTLKVGSGLNITIYKKANIVRLLKIKISALEPFTKLNIYS